MAGLQLTKIVSRGRLITVELTSKPRNKPTQMSTMAPLASMSVKLCFLVFLQTLASRHSWQCPDAGGCTDEDDLSQ